MAESAKSVESYSDNLSHSAKSYTSRKSITGLGESSATAKTSTGAWLGGSQRVQVLFSRGCSRSKSVL